MRQRCDLIIIDPQVDFCAAPGTRVPIPGYQDAFLELPSGGTLFVPGAEKDTERLANFVRENKRQIHNIRITLDSHQTIHIAHPIFWVGPDGQNPPFFTTIKVEDVEEGRWRPAYPHVKVAGRKNPDGSDMTLAQYAPFYVKQLKQNNRYELAIWPPHCHVGSVGTAVHPVLYAALREWEDQFRRIDFVTKGNNPWTEHYSAAVADVVDPTDPTTALNTRLVSLIEEVKNQGGIALWAGQAKFHCLANTFSDVISKFADDDLSNMVLLEDATSPVPGVQTPNDDWVSKMVAKRMQVSSTTQFFA